MHHVDALNAAAAPDTRPMDRAIAREAAQWLMRLHSGEATEADMVACQHWRTADPEHERAWQRAQRVNQKFGIVPPGIGIPALDRAARGNRRRDMLKTLLVLMTAVPTGYVAYRATPAGEWAADHRTATGERREIKLADGTRLHLNTASAIDVAFDADRRLVILRAGEILIATAPDAGNPSGTHRPFIVQTGQGSIRALGTRFIVRQDDGSADRTRVAVLQGAVEIQPRTALGQPLVIAAGQQTSFTSAAVDEPGPADPHAADWAQGVFYANRMRLGDFAAELGRHRPGLLRCDPAVADLRITGAFQLNNTDNVLAALPDTLPVSVVRRTRYWVSIVPPQGEPGA